MVEACLRKGRLRLPCAVAKHEFMVPTDRREKPFLCPPSLTELLMESYFRSMASFVICHSTV